MSTAKHAKMLYILAFLSSNIKGEKKFIPDKILSYIIVSHQYISNPQVKLTV